MPNERLRAALLERGMTPAKLAEALEVDTKTVERWITGGREFETAPSNPGTESGPEDLSPYWRLHDVESRHRRNGSQAFAWDGDVGMIGRQLQPGLQPRAGIGLRNSDAADANPQVRAEAPGFEPGMGGKPKPH